MNKLTAFEAFMTRTFSYSSKSITPSQAKETIILAAARHGLTETETRNAVSKATR